MTLKPAGVISSDDAPQTTIVSGGVRLLTMWSTVLVLALSVICEPVRIGLVVLMLNRRRPLLHCSHSCAVVTRWLVAWPW